MQEVLQDKISFQLKLEEQRERLEMLSVENHNLKEKVIELEEDGKQHRRTIKNQNQQLTQYKDIQITFEKAK